MMTISKRQDFGMNKLFKKDIDKRFSFKTVDQVDSFQLRVHSKTSLMLNKMIR